MGDGMTLEKLQVLIEAQTKPFRDEIEKVNKQVNSMTKNVTKQVNSIKNIFSRVGKAIAVLGIGKVFKDSITSAMEAIEGENLFQTVFGNLSNDMRQWSDDLQDTLGINAYAARNNSAVLYNIASNMGVASGEAQNLSKDMTLLSEDMASFYNLDSETAFNKIRSGLTGETEPLKQLGILVDENTLKQYGYNSSMTNAEKIMVRYQAILAQTGSAQGDLARTLNSPANQLRILKNNLSLVSVELGKAFMPIVQVVLPILNSFVVGIMNGVKAIGSFMNALFGTNINTSSSGIGQLASSTEGFNSALSDTGDTAKKTSKEVNKLLGGFDEVNVLNKDNATDAGGSAIGGLIPSGVGTVDLGQGEFVESTNMFEEAANRFKSLFEPMKDSFNNLKESIMPVVDTIGEGLLWLWDNILVPFGTWTISKLIPEFFNLLASIFDVLNPLLEGFMIVGAWLWDSFLQPIASWTGGVIIDVLSGLSDVLSDIGAWMSDNQDVVAEITKVVIGFFAAWEVTKLLGFIGESGGVIKALQRITTALFGATAAKVADKIETIQLTAMYAKDFIMSIVNGTKEMAKQVIEWYKITGVKKLDALYQGACNVATGAWNIICGIATTVTTAFGSALAFLTSPIGLVILAIGAIIGIIALLIKNWETVTEVASAVWDGIVDIWQGVATWFDENVVQPIANLFSGMWEGIKNAASSAWDWILGLFTKGGQIFSGVVGAISDVFKTIVNSIIKGINLVISTPFNTINGLLNSIRNVEIMGFTPFDEFWGQNPLPVPKIPMLAKGGIVNSATLAVVGEAGKEAVMPLENNTGWISLLAGKLALAMPQGSGENQSGPLSIILEIGGTALGRVVIDSINKLQKQEGKILLDI